ncbi:putative squalene monooxygenase [Helianthus annuus]|nr:putative squalene monooxygenase [Helianthus annuus]
MKGTRDACFDYLSIGNVCSIEAVGLLSGLNPSPVCLVLHSFVVVVYGFCHLLLPLPNPKWLWIGVRFVLLSNQDSHIHYFARFSIILAYLT